jgi:hypothetical protein
VTRCEPVGAFGEARCLHPHGNSPESMCDACEQWAEDSREAHEWALTAALLRLTVQMSALSARAEYDRIQRIVEGLVDAVTQPHHDAPDTCLLCGSTDGCEPGCATEALSKLLCAAHPIREGR